MAYRLNVIEHADLLLDHLVYHLIYRLKSEQEALYKNYGFAYACLLNNRNCC